ncbi:MAG TPA: carboxypeptidase-like regulatory domain-containing protein [Bryobacteraceae bacterium]|nr:carboxypeptidase-like regulatory domain-containing protein [Bryobacteraceae bacterium]
MLVPWKALLRGVSIVAFLVAGPGARAQDSGSIDGKAVDTTGAPILGAVVTVQPSGGESHTTVTDSQGAFQISSLRPGNYTVKISASGLADWSLEDVPAAVTPQSRPLLAILHVAPAVTSVTVGAGGEEVAQEQLHQEEQQRVLAVLPNYYVAYEEHPARLAPKQKLHLGLKLLFDPATIAGVAITAGIQQHRNSYWQYGQGAQGFAKRFGADYATATSNVLIASVMGASVLHQDPRYFYSGKGSAARRAWYAVESAFRAKSDNGKWEPPYAGVIGAIAAAELSQTYLPGSRTQYTLLGRALMFHFAGLIGINLSQELFLKKLTTHKPEDQSGENGPVLREGTPVTLIAVDGFGASGARAGQTVTLVLARELMQGGTVLARAGDIASGLVTQVNTGGSSVELQRVTLRAGPVNVPLRSSQARGSAGPVQYRVLPGSGKVEVTLFVAENVKFPESQ